MPVTSSSSSVKRWPATEAVLDALRAWAEAEAARRPELEALGYFGSYARGDEGFGSDLDLVAVVARSALPQAERPRAWKTEALPVPADLLVYTTSEWESLQGEGGRFARTLAAEAVWLVDRRAARKEPGAPARSACRSPSDRGGTTSPSITRGLRAFMARDWRGARGARDGYWAERVGRLGPLEALRIADELRRQALLQHPDWPDAASRRDDLRHHVRMTELFARADAALRARSP